MQRYQELLNSHRLLTREVESIREKIGSLISRQSIVSNKMSKLVDEMTECHKDLYRTAVSYEDQIFTRDDEKDFSVMNIDHPFENQEKKNDDHIIDRNLIKQEHTEAICHWQGDISIQSNKIKMIGPLIITAGDIEEYRSSLEGTFRLKIDKTLKEDTTTVNPPIVLIMMRCSNKSHIVVDETNEKQSFKAVMKITDKRSLRIEKMFLTQHTTQDIDLKVRGNFTYKNGMAEMDLITISEYEEKYTD